MMPYGSRNTTSSTYSVCPSVHVVGGTHIAARTKNIRIGTAVSLASFYHPLRLAEEGRFAGSVSGGRVNWGAGRGFDLTEHRIFGVEQARLSPVPRSCGYPCSRRGERQV